MNSRYQGPIIDAHHHLWDLSLGRHPWLTSDDSAIKALGDIAYMRKDYLVDDFIADIGPQNVVGSVYVEAAGDRTRQPIEEIEWLEGWRRLFLPRHSHGERCRNGSAHRAARPFKGQ